MQHAPAIKRRSFLAAALGMSAAAVAAAIAARHRAPVAVAPAAVAEPAAAGSYHETEHIRKYYRSAAYF